MEVERNLGHICMKDVHVIIITNIDRNLGDLTKWWGGLLNETAV